jgi:hypothetical protein
MLLLLLLLLLVLLLSLLLLLLRLLRPTSKVEEVPYFGHQHVHGVFLMSCSLNTVG